MWDRNLESDQNPEISSQNSFGCINTNDTLEYIVFPKYLQESCCKPHYPLEPIGTENFTFAFTSLAGATEKWKWGDASSLLSAFLEAILLRFK